MKIGISCIAPSMRDKKPGFSSMKIGIPCILPCVPDEKPGLKCERWSYPENQGPRTNNIMIIVITSSSHKQVCKNTRPFPLVHLDTNVYTVIAPAIEMSSVFPRFAGRRSEYFRMQSNPQSRTGSPNNTYILSWCVPGC